MKRARTRLRGNARVRPSLRFEVLEQRQLLAAAAFSMNLYDDVAGTPGEIISNRTVLAGQSFFVEILAQNLEPHSQGLHGVYLDLQWNPDAVQEIDAPFLPGSIVTSRLPLFQLGKLDNEAGRIDDLGGNASGALEAGRIIGAQGPERFALLRFEARTAAGESTFVLDVGLHNISHYPPVWTSISDFDFAPLNITVTHATDLPANSFASSTLLSSKTCGSGGTSLTPDFPSVSAWQNPACPYDVDGKFGVTPLDALTTINYLNEHPGHFELPATGDASSPYYDVNGDGLCSPQDALSVINYLSNIGLQVAEGEDPPAAAYDTPVASSADNLPMTPHRDPRQDLALLEPRVIASLDECFGAHPLDFRPHVELERTIALLAERR